MLLTANCSTALQAAACQAARCYFVAHTQLAAGRRPEAAALFQRALEHVQTATDRYQVGRLVDLSVQVAASQCLLPAHTLPDCRLPASGSHNHHTPSWAVPIFLR